METSEKVRVALGSKNPVKMNAAKGVLQKIFKEVDFLPIEIHGLDPQPLGRENTLLGAVTRAKESKRLTGADFGLGMEGGIEEISRWGPFVLSAAAVVSDDEISVGFGSTFPLPKSLYKKLLSGEKSELGELIDEISGIDNSKKKLGAIGVFTKGLLERKTLFETALITALIPVLSPDLFAED